MDNPSPLEPIWVTDPESKREVNVAPFIAALNTFDSKPNIAFNTGGLAAVRRVLRRLNLTVHDRNHVGFEEVANLYYDLHIIEDMFDQTSTRVVE